MERENRESELVFTGLISQYKHIKHQKRRNGRMKENDFGIFG
jgi:hypothetical protein